MNTQRNNASQPRALCHQQGVVLVVALLMLLVLTLLGLAATRSSSLEQHMASNTQDYQLAFQAAEAGLVDCEDYLNQVALPAFDGTGGLYMEDTASTKPLWETIDWDTDALQTPIASLNQQAVPGSLAKQPRCIIEQLPAITPPGSSLAANKPGQVLMYRVTVQATGQSPNTIVHLQTTYER